MGQIVRMIFGLCVFLVAGAVMVAEPAGESRPVVDAGDRRERMEKFIERLPPEARERMRLNLERLRELPEGRREELRQEAARHLRRMREDYERAVERLDVDALSPETREAMRARFFEMRRELERALRAEMMRQREEGVRRILRTLVEEFEVPEKGEGSGGGGE